MSYSTSGVYVMKVASRLTGLHPQTLRKYERAGLISPSRKHTLRLYSDEDIARLNTIKQLVNESNLNLAGVRKVLEVSTILKMIINVMDTASMNRNLREIIGGSINQALIVLGSNGG